MAIICDGTGIIFDGETKISTGKQQKQDGESALNSNLTGKHIFLAGHPFTSAGQHFSGVITEGVSKHCVISFSKYKVVFSKELIAYNSNDVATTRKTNFSIVLC